MAQVADCIFCKIVSGEAPGFRVCEDAHTLVFLDLFPVAPGHALVVTKDHYENLYEAPPEALERIARTAKRVAHAMRTVLTPDGLGVYQLNGAAAGQTVFHYHMHLVPRAAGDALTLHGRKRADEEELRAMAARLSAALPAQVS